MGRGGELKDVVIVGSGPIGLSCGIEAVRRGYDHLILDKGCLLQSIVSFPLTMTFFSTPEKLEIGEVPFISHGTKPTRAEALEYYRRAASHWNLRVRTYEAVREVTGSAGDFSLRSEKGRYRSRSVILATGFYDSPNLMGVPGEDLPKVTHYYREPFPYVGCRVLVVGGGNSAVDAALETWRKGAQVTILSPSPALDESVKYWVLPDIEHRIDEGSITACFESRVLEIREGEVVISTPAGERILENDFVLAMTGYHPDYEFLGKVGVDCREDTLREPVYDPATFESTVPGIFVAGVLCNGMQSGRWLIENSRHHGKAIFDRIEELLRPSGGF